MLVIHVRDALPYPGIYVVKSPASAPIPVPKTCHTRAIPIPPASYATLLCEIALVQLQRVQQSCALTLTRPLL